MVIFNYLFYEIRFSNQANNDVNTILKDKSNSTNLEENNKDSDKNKQTTSSEEIDTIQIGSDEYYYVYEDDNSYDSYFDNDDPNSIKKNKIKKKKTTTKPTTVNMITTNKKVIEEAITKKDEVKTEPSIQKPDELKENQQTSNQIIKEDEDVDELNGKIHEKMYLMPLYLKMHVLKSCSKEMKILKIIHMLFKTASDKLSSYS